MLNLSDGVKKALILIPTQPLPAKVRVAQRRKRLRKQMNKMLKNFPPNQPK